MTALLPTRGRRRLAVAATAALALAPAASAQSPAPAPAGDPGIALMRVAPGAEPRYDVLLLDPDGRRAGRILPVTPAGVWAGLRSGSGMSWMPDGQTLLLTGAVGGGDPPDAGGDATDLFAVGADGLGLRRLTRFGDAGLPVASPDGTAIAFARSGPITDAGTPTFALWRLDAAGGSSQALPAPPPGAADLPGSWSPDGQQLAFTRVAGAGVDGRGRDMSRWSVWVVDADGTGARRLGEGRAPAWSPDGTRIAFVSDRDRNGELCYGDVCRPAGELYVMAADGSERRRLTRSAAAENIATWAPSGDRLALERGVVSGNAQTGSVWVMDADGRCERPLALDRAGFVSYAAPAWRPGTATEDGRGCPAAADLARALPAVAPDGLDKARRVRGFPVYWPGPAYDGRRLTAAFSSPQAVGFFYGDCRRPAPARCDPIQVQVFPACAVPVPSRRGPGGGALRQFTIRGAVAYRFAASTWELHTRRAVVRIFGAGGGGLRLIGALRGLNPPAGGVRAGEPLPPPRAIGPAPVPTC